MTRPQVTVLLVLIALLYVILAIIAFILGDIKWELVDLVKVLGGK